MAISKNDAQLNQDYGVKIGSIGGIPVNAPSGALTDAQAYNLVYDEDSNSFTLTAVSAG